MKRIVYTLLFISIYSVAHSQIITTIGGLGPAYNGYTGDDGSALLAELNHPYGLDIDDSDNIFFADNDNNVIRKIEHSSGKIYTVAGNYAYGSGYSGDGGPATLAELNFPTGVAVDDSDNIYFCDGGNEVVRKVDHLSGIIHTVAGIGVIGYSGNGGPATNAELFSPIGIALDDSANIYIADFWNNVVREVEHTTGIISNAVGNAFNHGTPYGGYSGDGGAASAAELWNPTAVYVADSGKIYTTDASNALVRYVNPKGIISTLAGNFLLGAGYSGDGGAATAAELSEPTGVCLDDSGSVLISDVGDEVIRKVEHNTGIISTVGGNHSFGPGYSGNGGPATAAEIRGPEGIVMDTADNIIFADNDNNVIRKISKICYLNSRVSVVSNIPCYGSSNGNAGAFPLNGTSPYTYTWSDMRQQTDSIATGLSAGAYFVFITDNAGCDTTDTLTVTQPPRLTASAGNLSICAGQTAHFSIQASGGVQPYSYNWSNGDTYDTLIVRPVSYAVYTLMITDSNGCVLKDSATVTLLALPSLTLSSSLDTVCNGDTVSLSASGANTYAWSPPPGLSCNSCPAPTATPTVNTTYTVVGTSVSGCKDSLSKTIDVSYIQGIGISAPDTIICKGSMLTLTSSGSGNYLWNNGATTSSIEVQPDSVSRFSVTVNNGCISSASILIFAETPILFACCDTTVIKGDTALFVAFGSHHYQWSPATGLNCDSCGYVLAAPNVTTTYTVTGTDAHGCSLDKVMTVTVEFICTDFYIPNVFTPNGDGINDYFAIKAENLTNYTITIYDRWDREVYSSTDPAKYWDGKAKNNQNVPDGVYYYIIKSTCQNKPLNKSGFVQVLR